MCCFSLTNLQGQDEDARRSLGKRINALIALFLIIGGTFLTVAGTYGAIVALVNDKSHTRPWTCEDNSASV